MVDPSPFGRKKRRRLTRGKPRAHAHARPSLPSSAAMPPPAKPRLGKRTRTATLEREPARRGAPKARPPPPPPSATVTTEAAATAWLAAPQAPPPPRRSRRIAAARDARRARPTASLDGLVEPGLYVYVALALVEDRVGALLLADDRGAQVRAHRPACPNAGGRVLYSTTGMPSSTESEVGESY